MDDLSQDGDRQERRGFGSRTYAGRRRPRPQPTISQRVPESTPSRLVGRGHVTTFPGDEAGLGFDRARLRREEETSGGEDYAVTPRRPTATATSTAVRQRFVRPEEAESASDSDVPSRGIYNSAVGAELGGNYNSSLRGIPNSSRGAELGGIPHQRKRSRDSTREPSVNISEANTSTRAEYGSDASETDRMADFCAKLLRSLALPSGDGMPTSDQLKTGGGVSSVRKPTTLKLDVFTGQDISLESFLGRFEDCAWYYNWGERERLVHLKSALGKQAAELVWQLPKTGTEKDLIKLLQSHYGCETQRRRYRQELKRLKRKPGQTIQDLHGEVSRLMGLAFPGETGPRFDADAVESFINAFPSKSMRWRMRNKELLTLSDAMTWASMLESYCDESSEEELLETSPARPKNTKVQCAGPG